jgi:hypothetical protein
MVDITDSVKWSDIALNAVSDHFLWGSFLTLQTILTK